MLKNDLQKLKDNEKTLRIDVADTNLKHLSDKIT